MVKNVRPLTSEFDLEDFHEQRILNFGHAGDKLQPVSHDRLIMWGSRRTGLAAHCLVMILS
jgi:hypothetical protein